MLFFKRRKKNVAKVPKPKAGFQATAKVRRGPVEAGALDQPWHWEDA